MDTTCQSSLEQSKFICIFFVFTSELWMFKQEAIPEVAGHLVHPGGAAGASSSPLFSSAWGRLGRSSASQSTFQVHMFS